MRAFCQREGGIGREVRAPQLPVRTARPRAGSLEELNTELRQWVWEVANQRIHGTTHTQIMAAWQAERTSLTALDGRPPYPFADEELRKVARDAFVSWNGSRYSVPGQYAGREV